MITDAVTVQDVLQIPQVLDPHTANDDGRIFANTWRRECSLEIGLLDGDSRDNRGATIYIKELDRILCVKLDDGSLAVLSLGMLCETMATASLARQ